MSEEDTLLHLVQGGNGDAWAAARTGWNQTAGKVCDWEGISCNQHDEVIIIDLEGSGLVGTVPSSLGMIKSLRYLNLNSNDLHGKIPKEIFDLPNLLSINLAKNDLRGTIPALRSTQIVEINLSHNFLHGSIPADMGRWNAKLTTVHFGSNHLEGTIPTNLRNLQDLVTLNLSDNIFHGTIPIEIAQLQNLRSLSLHDNELVGNIPVALTSNLILLEHLLLQNNQLSGTIPADLAKLPNLKVLLVDRNRLTGTVPEPLCQRDLNHFLFSPVSSVPVEVGMTEIDDTYADRADNDISTKTTDHPNKTQSHVSDMCATIACPGGYRSDDGNGNSGVYPCVRCNETYFNEYLGAESCNTMSEAEIFHRLVYQNQDPTNDPLGVDPSTSDISLVATSPCLERGVTCNDDGHITAIFLEKSNLEGTIPEELGYLPQLEELDLSENLFRGKIPASLRFAPLRRLDLSGNLLTGIIPPELCRTPDINGNGKDGIFSCDYLACPVGTFNPNGYAEKCFECGDELRTLGSRNCGLHPLPRARMDDLSKDHVRRTMGENGKLIAFFVTLYVATVCCWLRRYHGKYTDGGDEDRSKHRRNNHTERTRLDDWYDLESEYSENEIRLNEILEDEEKDEDGDDDDDDDDGNNGDDDGDADDNDDNDDDDNTLSSTDIGFEKNVSKGDPAEEYSF